MFKASDTHCQVHQPRKVLQICYKQYASYLSCNLSNFRPNRVIPVNLGVQICPNFNHLKSTNNYDAIINLRSQEVLFSNCK